MLITLFSVDYVDDNYSLASHTMYIQRERETTQQPKNLPLDGIVSPVCHVESCFENKAWNVYLLETENIPLIWLYFH